MSDKTILEIIKTTVLGLLPDARILLFGSRARGDYNKNSDFDILIITPQTFALEEKKDWKIKIKKALLKTLTIPVDILINSEKEIFSKKELPGHTIRWAMKEGIPI